MSGVEANAESRTTLERLTPYTAIPPVVFAVTGLVLALTTDVAGAVAGHVFEDVVLAIVWSALAAAITVRMPRHPLGWLFIVIGASHGLAVAAGQYALAAVANDWPAPAVAGWISEWSWAPGMFLPLTIVILLFPNGKLPSPRWSPVLWLATAGIVGMTVSLAFGEAIELGPDASVANPLGVGFAGPAFTVFATITVVAGIASLTSLILRLRASTGDARRQLAPVVVASVLVVLALFLAVIIPDWAPVIQLVVFPLLPLAVALAVLRFRLYSLELIVRRSVIFVGLTALVVVGYALVVEGLSALLRSQGALPESLLATGVVALAFQPARIGLQRLASRALYGERDDPVAAVVRAGKRMGSARDPDAALAAAALGIRESLRLPWVAVYDETGELVASSGERPHWASFMAEWELSHLGQSCGCLALCRRSPREGFTSADERLIGAFLSPIAATLASRRFVDDLRDSRERLVLAQEEERHRLRRDIHDGLGPMLAAVAMHADVAMLQLDRAPDALPGTLSRLRSTATDAMADVRRIIEDLRPAPLTELGLLGALDEFCRRRSSPEGAIVTLAADPELPPAAPGVEVAVYRVATEAVTNALRHGDPTEVRVDLTSHQGWLDVVVTDDGHGWDVDAASDGVGLPAMRERSIEIGGRLTIESSSTGTTVHASFPVTEEVRNASRHLR
ncbi:MAG TPA: sensor histidine kinase [Microbacterium sp.]|nr:sensor histidine kinase [Microbacterium sp.]